MIITITIHEFKCAVTTLYFVYPIVQILHFPYEESWPISERKASCSRVMALSLVNP